MALPKTIITLLAAGTLVLLDAGGALKGSVGGSLVILLVLLAAALVGGLYDAWSMQRGVLGWIGSIVVAVLGTMVGAMVAGALMDIVIPFLSLDGRPGPIFLVLSAIIALTGAWIALYFVGRLQRAA